MILEGTSFGRVTIRMKFPTRSQSFLGKYLVIFTSTFVLRCLLTSPVSPLNATLLMYVL